MSTAGSSYRYLCSTYAGVGSCMTLDCHLSYLKVAGPLLLWSSLCLPALQASVAILYRPSLNLRKLTQLPDVILGLQCWDGSLPFTCPALSPQMLCHALPALCRPLRASDSLSSVAYRVASAHRARPKLSTYIGKKNR